MFKKKFYLNLFFIGFILILIQSIFQHYNDVLILINKSVKNMLPFIYAIFVAILLTPIVNLFENKFKIKRIYGIILSLVLIILIITGVFFIVVPNLVVSVSDLVNKFPQMLNSFNDNATKFIQFLRERNLLFFNPDELESNIINYVKSNIGNFRNLLLNLSLDVVQGIFGLLNFFLGIFLALYLIESKEYYVKFLENFFFLFTTKEKANNIVNLLEESKSIFLKYIWGRLITSFAVGVTAYIVMVICKVPYALISALLIGIGNMIPYVGSIVAGSIAVFLIVLAAPIKVLYLFIAIAIGQSVDGFILGPKILSETVGMSSFWTIVAVIVCGNCMGPLGLFLGVPIFGVIKLIYNRKLQKKENL
ncbi:MAG: AI-2E family transporter [Cetobacterium sp.]